MKKISNLGYLLSLALILAGFSGLALAGNYYAIVDAGSSGSRIYLS